MNPKNSADSAEPNWVRMRFKNSKVWVAADAEGRPLETGGSALIKYQLDQPQDYRVRAENLRRLDEVAAAPRAPAAKAPPRPAPAVTDCPEEGVVHIYTDGASSGNPGPSGIGVVLMYGSQRKEIGEYVGEATNNIAELLAIQKGLAAVKRKPARPRLYGQQLRPRGADAELESKEEPGVDRRHPQRHGGLQESQAPQGGGAQGGCGERTRRPAGRGGHQRGAVTELDRTPAARWRRCKGFAWAVTGVLEPV
jgi:ribonuclease HI